jgi:hypothetical protein
MNGSRQSGFRFSYNGIMEYGIREHALYYALLAKAVLETDHLQNAETCLKHITEEYGRRRGARMRANAAALCPADDLSAFFLTGEWAGKPGENQSELLRQSHTTESRVHVCAWYDTWKKYGLLSYGTYYCRWIDLAIADGFDGSFTLSVPQTKGAGDPVCRFVWDQTVNTLKSERLYLLPFSFHIEELRQTAEDVLRSIAPEQAEAILKRTEDAFQEYVSNP